MEAAVRAGADAVYFGLQGFNARARATNFDAAELGRTLAWLHERGVRGYVTLNTLVFDAELDAVEAAIRTCAEAGVDAVIVQDLGVAKLARHIAPSLPVHASTQMTCTDASSVELAHELHQPRDAPLVHPARDLVEQQHARLGGQRPRQLEALALPGGERPRMRMRLLTEPDPGEQRVRALARVAHVAGARERAHHDIVHHAHAREGPELLERPGNAQPADMIR